jgi:hypothetical protein
MNEVIHLAANIVLSAYTYTQVYAGTAQSPTINGVTVSMAAGSSIPILVKSISATADVYCLGKLILISPQYING